MAKWKGVLVVGTSHGMAIVQSGIPVVYELDVDKTGRYQFVKISKPESQTRH
jgi:hypothetical protein